MRPTRAFVAFALACIACIASSAPLNHNYDLKDVLWKLSFSMEHGTIAGDVTNTLTLGADSSTIELHASDLNVLNVLVDGVPAKFATHDNLLVVTLPTAGKSGQTLKVRTAYTAAPVSGLYFVPDSRAFPSKTGMIYTQGEGEDNHNWLPTYDFPDDKATFESYITVPKNWTAISNGKLLSVQEGAKTRVFHWKLDQPCSTYLISLVAGQYTQVKDHWRNVPVDFYVPPGLEKEGKASFGDTPKMIELYSKLTGVDYPYAKFAQDVVADFMYGGMENVSCVTQTIRTLHAAGTEPVADSTYLVAHELAHHWFGDLITTRDWEHTWLNEGFATTLPMFYGRATRGQDSFDMDRYNNFEAAINSIGSRGRKEIPGAAVGSNPTVNIGSVYDGGCSRIMMLMHLLGEDAFWKAIHSFLDTYRFKNAITSQFFDVVSASSGLDLNAFQRQWYYSTHTPSLAVSAKKTGIEITQLQPYYTLDLPVWVLDGSHWVKKSVHIDGATASLDFGEMAGRPFLIDPEVWTLMELKYNVQFTAHDVYEMYTHAPNAAQKARIIGGLFDSIPVAMRISIARSETLPALLQMIAPKLGQDGGSYLLELTHHADKLVVNAAILALGALKSDPTFIDRLTEIAHNDSNELIRERASKALLDWSASPALANQLWTMNAFDDGYRRMSLDWYGTHLPDEARTRSLGVLAHPTSEPVRVVAIHVLGRVKEAPGEHLVYDALIKVAQETSYGARAAAIASLAQLGNKAAIPILQPFVTHAPGGIQNAARSAIQTLQNAH